MESVIQVCNGTVNMVQVTGQKHIIALCKNMIDGHILSRIALYFF